LYLELLAVSVDDDFHESGGFAAFPSFSAAASTVTSDIVIRLLEMRLCPVDVEDRIFLLLISGKPSNLKGHVP
jgi:hypothetical protein